MSGVFLPLPRQTDEPDLDKLLRKWMDGWNYSDIRHLTSESLLLILFIAQLIKRK